MSVASAAIFEERVDPGKLSSAVLAAGVHLALLAVLVFGVRWQNRPAEAVSVELWEPPPPAPVVEAPKPAPEPPVVVKPEAPKPEPAAPKPEIVERKTPPPKPKPEPKAEPKPVPKAEPLKPRVDATQKRIREELAREEASLAIDRERRQIKDQLAREASAVTEKARAEWVDKIRIKIRSNIVLPPDLQGNPEAQIIVVLLPTGEVLSRKITKSSGHHGYDDAVERALLKSSPLPKPDRPEIFSRELKLTFRPKD